MSKPVPEGWMYAAPAFWAERLAQARATGEPDQSAVYAINHRVWKYAQEVTRDILREVVPAGSVILDAGCGQGHLADCLPEGVNYTGIDISPDFIDIARRERPGTFLIGDLRDLPFGDGAFNFAIMRGTEGALRGHLGAAAWAQIRSELERVARKLVFINYPQEIGETVEWRVETVMPAPTPVPTSGPLNVWFPHLLTEAHRQTWQAAALVTELAKLGIHCHLHLEDCCTVAFIAAFDKTLEAAHGTTVGPAQSRVHGYKGRSLRVVHYCWDLYPFKVEIPNEDSDLWAFYVEELKHADRVLVPSEAAGRRVLEYTGRAAEVVKCSVNLWDCPPEWVRDGGYVVDVMRSYPGEPNVGLCKRVCDELSIPCEELGDHGRSWDDYRRLIAGASLLVSTYHEASTGGLALLEGYRLGKPVLIADSPCHGGRDYFGKLAYYFAWNDHDAFREDIKNLWKGRGEPKPDPEFCRRWVETEYSDTAFAQRLATELGKAAS